MTEAIGKIFYSRNNPFMIGYEDIMSNPNNEAIEDIELDGIFEYIKKHSGTFFCPTQYFYQIQSAKDFVAFSKEKLPAHTDNTNTIVHVSLSEHHAVIGCTRDGMTRKKSLSLHTNDELVKQFEQSQFSYEQLIEEMNKRVAKCKK
ncbi:MAG: hypothetical protein WCW84_13920 [Sulfurimonas sp.]|jgi:hypothetical protein